MCRNIKPLFNFEPPASEADIQAAALQFVRKISGMNKPTQANQAAFDHAIAAITQITQELLDSLTTNAPTKDRATETAKARERSRQRFNR